MAHLVRRVTDMFRSSSNDEVQLSSPSTATRGTLTRIGSEKMSASPSSPTPVNIRLPVGSTPGSPPGSPLTSPARVIHLPPGSPTSKLRSESPRRTSTIECPTSPPGRGLQGRGRAGSFRAQEIQMLQERAERYCKAILSDWGPTQGTLTFYYRLENIQITQFKALLSEIGVNRELTLILSEDALESFSDELLQILIDVLGRSITTVKFNNSEKRVANTKLFTLLHKISALKHLDLSHSQGFQYSDWKRMAILGTLEICNLSYCCEVTTEIVEDFLRIHQNCLQTLILMGIPFSSSNFERLPSSVRFLDLTDSLVQDESLRNVNLVNSSLTRISFSFSKKISEEGLVPFLKKWERIKKVDLVNLPKLTGKGVAEILNISSLEEINLSRNNAVTDEVLTQNSWNECRIVRLNIQQTQVKTPQALKIFLKQVQTLKFLSVPDPLAQLRTDFPEVTFQTESETFQMDEGNCLLVFKNYFPMSEFVFHKSPRGWDIRLFFSSQNEMPQWHIDQLPQIFRALQNCDVAVRIINLSESVEINPLFTHFIQQLKNYITSLSLPLISSDFYQFLESQKVKKLTLEGGHLSTQNLEKMDLPELTTLHLVGVSIDTRDMGHFLAKFENLEEYSLKNTPVQTEWKLISAFAQLPHVKSRYFVLPEADLDENLPAHQLVGLCFALWQNKNTDHQQKSKEIALGLASKIKIADTHELIKRWKEAEDCHFDAMQNAIIASWNESAGTFLTLDYTHKNPKAHLMITPALIQNLSLQSLTSAILLAQGIDMDWTIEFDPEITISELPDLIKNLAEGIALGLKNVTIGCLTPNAPHIPSDLCRPFLQAAQALTNIEFIGVSFSRTSSQQILPSHDIQTKNFRACIGS